MGQSDVVGEISVRELKTHASRILREVRDSRASFVLTHRGKAIGVILPLERNDDSVRAVEDDEETAWANFMAVGRRIAKGFRPGVSGVQILSEMRR